MSLRPAQSGDSPPSKQQKPDAQAPKNNLLPGTDEVHVTQNEPAPPASVTVSANPDEVYVQPLVEHANVQPTVERQSSADDLPPLPSVTDGIASASAATVSSITDVTSAAVDDMAWLYVAAPSLPPLQSKDGVIPSSLSVVAPAPIAAAAQQPASDYWTLQPAGTEAPGAGLATAAYITANVQPAAVGHWTALAANAGVQPPATDQQRDQLAAALSSGIQLHLQSLNKVARHVMTCFVRDSIIQIVLMLDWNKPKGIYSDKGAEWLCDQIKPGVKLSLCDEGFLVATTSCYVFRLRDKPFNLLRMSFDRSDKITASVIFNDLTVVRCPSEEASGYFIRAGNPTPPFYCMRYRPRERVPIPKKMHTGSIPDIAGSVGHIIVCFHGADTFTMLQLHLPDAQSLSGGFVVWMPHYGKTPRQVDVSRGYKLFGSQATNAKVPVPIPVDSTALSRLVSIHPLSSSAANAASPAVFLFCVNDANGMPNTYALIIKHPVRIPSSVAGGQEKATPMEVKVIMRDGTENGHRTVNSAICSIFGVEPH